MFKIEQSIIQKKDRKNFIQIHVIKTSKNKQPLPLSLTLVLRTKIV